MGLENVTNVVLILSGKGGVGKSSVTLQLALALTQQGHNVGILDIDLTGPSIPRLLGLEDKKVTQAPGGWLPVKVHDALLATSRTTSTNGATSHSPNDNDTATLTPTSTPTRGSLHALSLAFLLPSRTSAVIWRGPKKTAMIRQFVSDVLWPPNTSYLLIDTPPGTSDEHIAIVEELHKLHSASPSPSSHTTLTGAVIVTTPQAISTSDVRKELNFCTKTAVPVIGVVENMAGYMCPCCNEITNIFSKGGGKIMAEECGVPFLGSVPIDTTFGALTEGGEGELVERYRSCGLCGIFEGFAGEVVKAAREGVRLEGAVEMSATEGPNGSGG
jgi:Mrp family chromosome partitioning ATPase